MSFLFEINDLALSGTKDMFVSGTSSGESEHRTAWHKLRVFRPIVNP